MSVRFMFLAAALALPGIVVTAEAAEPMPVGCTGVFGKQATRESVTETFGEANVAHEYVELTDLDRDLYFWRTSVFGGEVKIAWADATGEDAKYSGSRDVRVQIRLDKTGRPSSEHYRWQSGLGVGIGFTIAEMEKLNGKPFYVSGPKYGGPEVTVVDWNGGALGKTESGCSTEFVLLPDYSVMHDRPGKHYRDCIICGKHRSDEDLVRNWPGAVVEFSVTYPADVVEHH